MLKDRASFSIKCIENFKLFRELDGYVKWRSLQVSIFVKYCSLDIPKLVKYCSQK